MQNHISAFKKSENVIDWLSDWLTDRVLGKFGYELIWGKIYEDNALTVGGVPHCKKKEDGP